MHKVTEFCMKAGQRQAFSCLTLGFIALSLMNGNLKDVVECAFNCYFRNSSRILIGLLL